ncbi:MAG TPA: histidine phosphatase family protein [Candidatus Angelobacter sp.]|nr:histidine phosphatase family protein [Candidatus Angelobacter sp.]
MAQIYLVRHGRATGTWIAHPDPGLDDVGREQAARMAKELTAHGPLPLVTSPLRRTRETASALEQRWGISAQVEPHVGEIPSPPVAGSQRADWLRGVLQAHWADLDPSLHLWRTQVLKKLEEFSQDTLVVSHFVAINAAVGHALKDDRVTCFRPDNCSCTVLDIQDGDWKIVKLGTEGNGKIF